jgi:AraC-like DNA-binding protein
MTLEERVGFRRRDDLPGVEVRDVENSGRRWRCFSTGYEFLAPRTWHGEILHRRARYQVVPGTMFCARPGEVFTTPRIRRAGSGSAITFDPELFGRYLAEHGLALEDLALRTLVHMSPRLSRRLQSVLDLLRPETPALELQSSVVSLVGTLVTEVVVVNAPRPANTNALPDDGDADRVRECLHYDETGLLDLERLAEQTRLNRFQVLRVFKHRYGLPPHAYQLRVRIGLAQRALRAGLALADVAVAQGFVDQSHFSKHFKQLVGVTPAQYARAQNWREGGHAMARVRRSLQ